MTPEPTPLNTLEARFTGGMLALNRLLMTLQNKRMPIKGFALGREAEPGAMRATILLECPPETALRYTALLSSLEDVEEVGPADEGLEVVLLKTRTQSWRASASRFGVEARESGGTVVASGEPEKIEDWLGALGEDVEDMVRLGPVARPGNGGV